MWDVFEDEKQQKNKQPRIPVLTFDFTESKRIENELFIERISVSQTWQSSGVCLETDPEIFFPTQNSSTIKHAKRVCDLCPVSKECLDFALAHNFRCGVWGGMTENERRRIKQIQKQSRSHNNEPVKELETAEVYEETTIMPIRKVG